MLCLFWFSSKYVNRQPNLLSLRYILIPYFSGPFRKFVSGLQFNTPKCTDVEFHYFFDINAQVKNMCRQGFKNYGNMHRDGQKLSISVLWIELAVLWFCVIPLSCKSEHKRGNCRDTFPILMQHLKTARTGIIVLTLYWTRECLTCSRNGILTVSVRMG